MTALLVAVLLGLPAAALPTSSSAVDPADTGHIFVRQGVAVAGWPSGFLSDTRAELRTPLHRSDSILFQDTSAGVGARVAITPAFVEAGPRFSLAPIDIFDVDLSVGALHYWRGPFGPLPTDHLGGTLQADRSPLAEQTVRSTGFSLQAAPTLKARLGPVILFDAWSLRHHRLARPEGTAEDWLYEPFTDLIVAWNDTILEHQPGLLFELLPDEGGAWLRAGGTMRDRWSLETGDRTLGAGALVAMRPGRSEALPTLSGLALVYAIDGDRAGGSPFLGLQASWIVRRSLRPTG